MLLQGTEALTAAAGSGTACASTTGLSTSGSRPSAPISAPKTGTSPPRSEASLTPSGRHVLDFQREGNQTQSSSSRDGGSFVSAFCCQ